jgi:hypothetical protein
MKPAYAQLQRPWINNRLCGWFVMTGASLLKIRITHSGWKVDGARNQSVAESAVRCADAEQFREIQPQLDGESLKGVC